MCIAVGYADTFYAPSSYTRLGANVGFKPPTKDWKASLYVKNLANDKDVHGRTADLQRQRLGMTCDGVGPPLLRTRRSKSAAAQGISAEPQKMPPGWHY